MRRAIVAAVVSLLFLADIAGAQTPGTSTIGPFTIGAEALMWWFKGNATPPLVADRALDDPGTNVFLGGKDLDTNPNPGLRLTAGYALSDRWGIDSSVFYVPTRTTARGVSSSGQLGSTDLFAPIIDATTGTESIESISSAGLFAGSARAELGNSLLGTDLNATMRVAAGGGWRVDALAGARYLRLRESFVFTTNSPNVPPLPADVYQTSDRFDATNNFFGGQLGVRARIDAGPWFATAVAKVGLGVVRQTVDIEGSLFTNDFSSFGTPVTYAGGGYFATPTNIGERTRHVFAVVPEAGLNVGYRVTPWMAIVAGYTFFYASDVVRAPDQINRTVNYSTQPPAPPTGPQEPSFRFRSSDFWAHGVNVGLSLAF
jgi:hypothetical protein